MLVAQVGAPSVEEWRFEESEKQALLEIFKKKRGGSFADGIGSYAHTEKLKEIRPIGVLVMPGRYHNVIQKKAGQLYSEYLRLETHAARTGPRRKNLVKNIEWEKVVSGEVRA